MLGLIVLLLLLPIVGKIQQIVVLLNLDVHPTILIVLNPTILILLKFVALYLALLGGTTRTGRI